MKKFTYFIIVMAVVIGASTAVSLYWHRNDKPTEPGPEAQAINPRKSVRLNCPDCNIIMISLSNVAAGHMGLYGYGRDTSPMLAEWARDAFVFENAYTQASWTLPVGTSLFTSLYPFTHNVTNRFVNNVLDKKIKTLPEILKEKGYRTAAFTGGLDYSGRFSHMRGFETVEEEGAFNSTAVSFAGFNKSLGKADNWIKEKPHKKFFAFIHGYDAHCPFNPPAEFKGVFSGSAKKNTELNTTECLRGYENSEDGTYSAYYYRKGSEQKVTLAKEDIKYLEDLYDEEILSVDRLVSGFLNGLSADVRDKTIVLIFSDHGEMFAKHGRFGRAGTVRGTHYNDVLHIPLMIKIPGNAGKRIPGLVQTIDVMPTVLASLDIKIKQGMQGQNLAGLISSGKEVNKYVFAGSKYGWMQGPTSSTYFKKRTINESVGTLGWKLIHEEDYDEELSPATESYELYNLKVDPDELKNIIDTEPMAAEELKNALAQWKAGADSFDIKNVSSEGLLPPEVVEEAKKRGYW